MELFIQQLINGISIGSQYALWTVGYGLVYQVLGLMHFAHGDTLIFAAFVFTTLVIAGVPLWAAILVAMLIAALIAVLIERGVYRPLMSRKQIFMAFIAAMAAGFILRNIARLIWGVSPVTIGEGLFPSETFVLGGFRVTSNAIINIVVAIVVVVAFQIFLSRSRHGQAITAVSQDRETAELMGINVNRIVALVYALSAIIGILGLILYITNFRTITIDLGFTITLKAFIAAIIGGIGSIRGAFIGGMALGILESLVGAYISTTLLDAIVIGVLIVFLLFRPNGFVGVKKTVKL
ncbi:branched-chain amino acid ABC transporter permease [Leucobacter rhizosphaerae]|uniref:Branched-chain amino acid ABC transporter permease n=1 Tax=Leucobacter rhizosphaerae TaxID=2932245 RepID=A0ABY4FU57_9MICO|nr:branched-chain amino acid ABC transporter permease [Leucobacter rhizosphaerae]UOQ59826.1 branched-chain amino acid ABC transporter permease [Leucobacter rhizosphaerae]